METKLRSSEWDSVKRKLKMPNALLVDGRGRKGGLGLLWPRDVSVEILSFYTHHIEACIKDGTNQPWRLVGFYGHHEVASRKHSWNLMRLLNGLSTLPTIFIGDFNEVLHRNEHVSQRRQRPTWQIERFRQVVRDCGLVDMGYNLIERCVPRIGRSYFRRQVSIIYLRIIRTIFQSY
ncbi:hypothetical protein LIER_08425 [Lithospermum erythrorhizon]|uniref:Endonuclease/exonuclease/phosphatase domain-containing protein n=1 Tax=Lithospermum erythrorhizon TaxID=34254 RepID=A0AAV3PBT7_LITER